MRLSIVTLLLILAGFQTSCAQDETPAEPETGAAQAATVYLEIDAGENLKKGIHNALAAAFRGKAEVVSTAGDADWSLRIIGLNSADTGIYCDSILTLSVVYLERAGDFRGQFAATFPSEDLEDECEKVAEDFVTRFP